MKKVLSTILLCTLGCASENNTSVAVKQDIEYCPAAQAHLQTLCQQDPNLNKYCCEVTALSLRGKEFAQICQEIQNGGIFISPVCIMQVTKCEDIDSVCMQQPERGNK